MLNLSYIALKLIHVTTNVHYYALRSYYIIFIPISVCVSTLTSIIMPYDLLYLYLVYMSTPITTTSIATIFRPEVSFFYLTSRCSATSIEQYSLIP